MKNYKQSSPTECTNCGMHLLRDNIFCPRCGQKNHDLDIPLRHLLAETVEVLIHFDNKSLNTLKALAFKPGLLTAAFIKGKRAIYVAPIRLYVFISFIFFLTLTSPSDKHGSKEIDQKDSSGFSVSFFGVNSHDVRGMNQKQVDSVMQAKSISQTAINKYLMSQLVRVGTAGYGEFAPLYVKGISYSMFALMPIFALVVFILHKKKARYYIGTLVFSIHYHSFAFLLLMLLVLVNYFINYSLIYFLPGIFFPVYLFLALKHVFGDSILRTLFKTLAVFIVHILLIIFVFIATVFFSLLVF